jgi:glutamate racemase
VDCPAHESAGGMIGILDSGFGGLSIYQSITALLHNESTVYIGDHAYVPYSTKTRHVILTRVKKLIQFLLSKQAKLVVIACNTATVAGIDAYRRWFPDIPIIGVVPVIKTAALVSKTKKIIVLSTEFTARSAYQRKLIRKFADGSRVFNIGCPTLVSRVEKGTLSGIAVTKELRTILTPAVKKGADVIALGCTHFPFLKDQIRAIVGQDIAILDSGGAVARHVGRVLEQNNILAPGSGGTHVFYSTRKRDGASITASTLLKKNIQVRYAPL